MSVQDITTIIGALGGASGLAALVASFLGRRKIRAEAADVITDTALTLVEPLQKRVRELDAEVTRARSLAREAADALADALSLIRRWRSAIVSQVVTREQLREMAREDLPADPGAAAER
ncbi:hypothetical protein [Mangrovihabitans endophyticus]|uniref:Uncharacterized protein n=1 Tax=Mangrovihabitans endophyticus TaxID=1751298 RepID=A0A8J3C017_9ACTN|nr:hypothetical protein [Mangrovihabitans endophyticus]GGK89073.1 hypothetical protein GCM10012284_23890 [Mangrovihabitans endophyticus]